MIGRLAAWTADAALEAAHHRFVPVAACLAIVAACQMAQRATGHTVDKAAQP